MIFGRESISTYSKSNMAIWMVMAFQGGVLNIGGFMACKSFISHVTGLATLLGMRIGEGGYLHALGLFLALSSFFVGAMLSGFLIDLRLKTGKKPKYHIVFGTLFLFLLFIDIAGFNSFFGEFGESVDESRNYTLLALLGLICGMQNGSITSVSHAEVRTTHLTGTTTDLGIGLVRFLNRQRLGHKVDGEGRASLMRAGLVVSFILGSAAGADLFIKFKFRGFILPTCISGLLFLMAFYFQVMRRTPQIQRT
jgi:uncharacterized membrane protein YoaK (UPF0700 family)